MARWLLIGAVAAAAVSSAHAEGSWNYETVELVSCKADPSNSLCATSSEGLTTSPDVATAKVAANSFKACVGDGSSGDLCACYKNFYQNICGNNAEVQDTLARLGFRFGVGYPTIQTYKGKDCNDRNFDDNGNYKGPGTVLSAATDCVPACAQVCSPEHCIVQTTQKCSSGVLNSIGMLLAAAAVLFQLN
mmetsp:Transcript_18637/g.59461  ORF Transcript_18637/g.59461 Transcript_18637/m.59461 type:complete len:190 (-) Transcript_18637:555-1124(-)